MITLVGIARSDAGPSDLGVEQARQPQIDLIIERRNDSIEIYIGGNAASLIQTLGANPELIANADGYVPFDAFQSGTWLLGDALFSAVRSRLAGHTLELEATSLMLHPADYAVPFRDALDGVMAISVCSVLDPPTDLTLSDATLYAGYIGFTRQADATLTLTAPEGLLTVDPPVMVHVRDFTNGVLERTYHRPWSVNAPLHLAKQPDAPTRLSVNELTVSGPFMAALFLLGLLGSLSAFNCSRLR